MSASERLHDREKTLALVSHDLRSPLNAMMMGAAAIERLAGRLPGGERIGVLAASHIDVTRRMSGMVDDLLAIAVATSGGRSLLKIATVSAASLLERPPTQRGRFSDEGIELEVEALGELPEIQVDSDRVLRVFANLLDNALKFTDRQGRVVLQAEAESDGMRFCVANSGPAISAAELDSMFKPFWQAGQGDRRGAGLGMSICRSIVEAHGGRIWAEPEAGQASANMLRAAIGRRQLARRRGVTRSVTRTPVRNGILAALLATEYKRILPRLEHVVLKRGEIVYRADRTSGRCTFPEEAVIAMVDTTDDRRTVEVGLIGREGIVGINIFLGGVVTPDRAIVQLPGGAFPDEVEGSAAGGALRQPASAAAPELHADVSCRHQPVSGLQPAPQRGAAPRALAAHHGRLCRRARVSDGP